MKRYIALVALLAFVALPSAAAGAARPVFKVDTVKAHVVPNAPNKLAIEVTGAVRSGGWANPHLRVKEVSIPESSMLVVEFVAVPPAPSTVVIQAVLPVTASITIPMPKPNITEVKITAETNSVTAPIVR